MFINTLGFKRFMFELVMFAVGVIVLMGASNLLVTNASKIAEARGVSGFVIGATIVAAGTSLPELASSVYAVISGFPGIPIGNVVGSNIANIALVIGVVAIVKQFDLQWKVLKSDAPALLASGFALFLVCYDLTVTLAEAALMLFLYLAFMVEAVMYQKGIEREKKPFAVTWFAYIVVAAVGIYYGAQLTIENAVVIARSLNLSESVIGFTMIALGTSLPELAASLVSAVKGKTDMSIGNIIGSNVFNAISVLGASAFFGAVTIPASYISFELPIMLVLSVLLVIMMLDEKITRFEGLLLFATYLFVMLNVF